MSKIEGGCLCGDIRYSSEAEHIVTVLCNCKNCQKQSGAAFSVNIAMPRGSLNVEGEMSCYKDMGDSGMSLNRFFCGNCGSPISSEPDSIPDFTVLKVGTLDDTSWVQPTMEIYCDSAQSWVELSNQLDKKPKGLDS